jgi:hypothetical protein
MRLYPPLPSTTPHISLPNKSNLYNPSPICFRKTRSSVPGGELLEGLLVVRVVGIDVAGELAGGDGESGALLLEDGSRGRAGEGGDGARARGAAEEGGDRHCEVVWEVWSGGVSEVAGFASF